MLITPTRTLVLISVLTVLTSCVFFDEPPGEGAKATVIFKEMTIIINEAYQYRIENGEFPKRLADLKLDGADFTLESDNRLAVPGKPLDIEFVLNGTFPTLTATYGGPGRNSMSFSLERSEWSISGYY